MIVRIPYVVTFDVDVQPEGVKVYERGPWSAWLWLWPPLWGRWRRGWPTHWRRPVVRQWQIGPLAVHKNVAPGEP